MRVVRRALLPALCLSLALAGASLEAPPAMAAPSTTNPAEANPQRPDSVSAMVTARVSGNRVEDLSQRDELSRVYANPDGTWTAETTPEPSSVQDPDNDAWHDIDTTLVPVEGGFAPRYAATDVRLSAGGDKTFARVTERGKAMSWRWASTLPEPVVEGATATYPDVVPGGDLVVTATSTGFTHNVVLRERPTKPVAITIPVAAQGAELSRDPSGGLQVATPTGKTLVEAPAPVMWDATKNEFGDHEHAAPVAAVVGKTAAGTPTVTLSPADAFLSDPATVYPVTVDPSFTTSATGDAWLENPNYTTGQVASEELRVGTYDGGSHVARAYMHFNGIKQDDNQNIVSASLILRNYYSGSCTSANIQAKRITSEWNGNTMTWANKPGGGDAYMDTYKPAHGYNSSCSAADATWDVTGMVQAWVKGNFANNGIMLRAEDETSIYSWRRYRSANYTTSPAFQPKIKVTYNTYPGKAGTPSVSPGNPGYTTSKTPTFKATVTDPDKGKVRGVFEVYQGSTLKWTGTSTEVGSGSTASVTVPAGKLVDGTTYTVKVKGYDGIDTSKQYSASTTFTVDATKPDLTTQDITSTVFTDGQWHADPVTANTFTFNGPSDTKSFTFAKDGVTQPVKSADSSGDATISWLPKDGWHTLTVTATDKAGNSSSTKASFSFGYGLASFVTTNASARSTGVFPIQLASRPDATDASLSWRYAGTTTWHKADGVTKNGQSWDNSVVNSSDDSQSVTGALLWDATAQVEDATAVPQKTIAAPALLELRTCFNYSTDPTQICSSALPVQLVPNAFGGNFPTTNVGPAQVALATGEMTFTEPDAVDSTAGVARTFSSFDSSTVQAGPFGPGWSSTLIADGDTSAELLDRDSDGTFVLVTAGNASQTYTLEPATGLYMPVGTDDGSRLSVGADTAVLTRPQSSTTSWKLQAGEWVIDSATAIDTQGATPSVDVTSDEPGYPSWIAQTAPGVSATCTETEQAEGCRGLKISYTGSGDATRVSKIELFTHDGSSTAATYSYNGNNELESVCGPDPDGSEELTSLCASYTYRPVAGRTLVASATPTGQAPWTFTYDNDGRLATVGRPLDPNTNTGTGPATWTVRYDLTPTAPGLPDMGAASIDRWGQEAVPAKVYAVFDPSDPNTTDVAYADLYYTDEADKTTNTAVHANVAGVSQWLVDTTWYDENDNVTQTLDGAGRAQALAAATLEDQRAAAVSASSFILYNENDTNAASPGQDGTEPASTTDGVRVQDEYGPVHTVTLQDGTTGPYRTHTSYVYDDQDPNLGGGSKPALDEGQTAFNLVVEERHSASDAERTNDYDTTVVRYDYDPIVAGDGNGWSLGTPTRTKVQLADGSWSTSVTRLDRDGRQIETRQPGGATDANGAGTDAHATVASYYAKNAPDADCDINASLEERASWEGLLCKTGPAGQPTGPSMPVTYHKAYDADLHPNTIVETSGTTTRTTTTAYDLLGRITSRTVTDGSDSRTTTMTYDATTGARTGESAPAGAVTTQFDTWGRPSSYADASGLVSITTYTADGQVATHSDGLGVYTYSYDTVSGEHRRLPDSVDVGLATGTPDAFNLTYDGAAAPSQVTYPNGMTATYTYDEAEFPISLDYADGTGNSLLSFANSIDVEGRVLTADSDASEQSYGYDNLGRLATVEDTRDGQCTTRVYGFSASSERTSFDSYGAAADGNCQAATATSTKANTYDSANRIRNAGYTYDDLGRTLAIPATDTASGAAGSLAANYFANDMIRSLVQTVDDGLGGTVTKEVAYALDPTGRIDSVINRTGGSETSRLRYRFSGESDAPTSIQASTDSGATWSTTRYVAVPGLGMVGSVTGNAITYSIVNMHGDVVATQEYQSGELTIDAFNETDEFGRALTGEPVRYSWLGMHQRAADAAGGMFLMGARVYNPSTGQFLSDDPVRGGNLTRYGYPLDPVNQADVTGESLYQLHHNYCGQVGCLRMQRTCDTTYRRCSFQWGFRFTAPVIRNASVMFTARLYVDYVFVGSYFKAQAGTYWFHGSFLYGRSGFASGGVYHFLRPWSRVYFSFEGPFLGRARGTFWGYSVWDR